MFLSYHGDGRDERGYASLEERGGCWDLGVDRGEPECWVPPTRMLGILVGGCLVVVLPVKRVSDSKGTGGEDPGCCFSLAISTGSNKRGCASQDPAGVGISGIRPQGQSTRCRVLDAPDAGVGTLVGGCLVVVLLVMFFSSALSRRSLGSLCSLPPTRVLGNLWGGAGTLVGRCWNPYGWLS